MPLPSMPLDSSKSSNATSASDPLCQDCIQRPRCDAACDRLLQALGPEELRAPREISSDALMRGYASFGASHYEEDDDLVSSWSLSRMRRVVAAERALASLAATQRQMVIAHLDGVPTRDTAARIGISADRERQLREGLFRHLRDRLVGAMENGVRVKLKHHERPVMVTTRLNRPMQSRANAMASSARIEESAKQLTKLLASLPKDGARVVDISPSLARAILARNRDNRSIAKNRVDRFVSDMRSGAWEVNNSGLGLGLDGELYDGQHRLHAVVRANLTVRMLVMSGLSRESRATIDQGRPRSVGDNLRILDGEVHGARIVGWLNAIEVITTGRSTPLSHAMVRQRLALYDDGIRWFISHAPRTRPFHRSTVIGAFVFAHRKFPKQTQEFALGYATGVGLPAGSPVLTLRDYVADPVRLRMDSSRVISLKALRCLSALLQEELIERLTPSEESVAFFRVEDMSRTGVGDASTS